MVSLGPSSFDSGVFGGGQRVILMVLARVQRVMVRMKPSFFGDPKIPNHRPFRPKKPKPSSLGSPIIWPKPFSWRSQKSQTRALWVSGQVCEERLQHHLCVDGSISSITCRLETIAGSWTTVWKAKEGSNPKGVDLRKTCAAKAVGGLGLELFSFWLLWTFNY